MKLIENNILERTSSVFFEILTIKKGSYLKNFKK